MTFELKCYDVVTDAEGNVGVVLPNPDEDGQWCCFYGTDYWNPITLPGLYNGSTPIVKVHRATDLLTRRNIACSVGYNNKERWTSTAGLVLVHSQEAFVLQLGAYKATFVGTGENLKLKVGCQEITREQIVAAVEAFQKLEAASKPVNPSDGF